MKHDDELLEAAAYIASLLAKGERGVPRAPYHADLDVDARRFQKQLSESGSRFPCAVNWPVPLPIDLASFCGEMQRMSAGRHQQLSRTITYPGLRISHLPRHEVEKYFVDRLSQTVSVRINDIATKKPLSNLRKAGGVLNWLLRFTEPIRPPEKLAFTVETQSHGLRVHYSPAYFLNRNLVFGAPTTPVVGELCPGRFIFGVATGNQPVQFNDAEYDVPPQKRAILDA